MLFERNVCYHPLAVIIKWNNEFHLIVMANRW